MNIQGNLNILINFEYFEVNYYFLFVNTATNVMTIYNEFSEDGTFDIERFHNQTYNVFRKCLKSKIFCKNFSIDKTNIAIQTFINGFLRIPNGINSLILEQSNLSDSEKRYDDYTDEFNSLSDDIKMIYINEDNLLNLIKGEHIELPYGLKQHLKMSYYPKFYRNDVSNVILNKNGDTNICRPIYYDKEAVEKQNNKNNKLDDNSRVSTNVGDFNIGLISKNKKQADEIKPMTSDGMSNQNHSFLTSDNNKTIKPGPRFTYQLSPMIRQKFDFIDDINDQMNIHMESSTSGLIETNHNTPDIGYTYTKHLKGFDPFAGLAKNSGLPLNINDLDFDIQEKLQNNKLECIRDSKLLREKYKLQPNGKINKSGLQYTYQKDPINKNAKRYLTEDEINDIIVKVNESLPLDKVNERIIRDQCKEVEIYDAITEQFKMQIINKFKSLIVKNDTLIESVASEAIGQQTLQYF